MSIHAAAAVLRPFVRAKLNPKAPVRPPELLNTGDCVKHHSPTSVTNAQTSTAFSVCVATPFPFCTWVYVPRASAGPCMSSNYTYTPFHVAAARRRPFWAHTWNKATGLRPGALTPAGPPCPAGLGLLPGPEHRVRGALWPEPFLANSYHPARPRDVSPPLQSPPPCQARCPPLSPESSSIGPSLGSVPISPKRL